MSDSAADQKRFETELIALIPNLRAFGRSLSGDAVLGDDLAQETLFKALRSQDAFTLGTNLKAWTFLILRNVFYSQGRQTWRTCTLDPEVAANTLVENTNPNAAIELDEVRRAMAVLPCEQREALVLIAAAGLSEVADITRTPIGTVKSRVNRARGALEAILAGGKLVADHQPAGEAMGELLAQATSYRTRRNAERLEETA